jgi:A/G-specific adenine glycosylase
MTLQIISTKPEEFREKLLNWWRDNRRNYPWRNTWNTYRILVSEILLHRTRADQVVPVYNEFIKEFPTVQHLARARQAHVTRLLRPLGLIWRNKLLKPLAKEIVSSHNGRVPSSKSQLESLPGVSNYIAAAVSCFAFGKTEPLLDTNTVRIIGRMFGLIVSDGSRRSNRFSEIYKSLISVDEARDFNYAMIELGALICSARNPECEICPINDMCSYGASRIGRAM